MSGCLGCLSYTFIAIDIVLEQTEKEGLVDISAAVTSMRQKRMKMVQTAVSDHFNLPCRHFTHFAIASL